MSFDQFSSVFVTGGAGFIGTKLLPHLQRLGRQITIFDSLHPQVHGENAATPVLPAGVAFIRGDVRDRAALQAAIANAEPTLIVHLAAETGTGQSYDEVSRYCDVNVQGTAYLAEALRALPPAPRRRVVLASSRAIYGEGGYRDASGALVVPAPRDPAAMSAGDFEPRSTAGGVLTAVATPEDAPAAPGSIYASTKLMQEYILSQALADSDIELVTLRFQNVYGQGQSLRNPYTGVLSIFGGQILSGKRLNIYEDGLITRDFVHVNDVVAAVAAAAVATPAPAVPINVGSGEATTILDAARALLRELGRPEDALAVTGDFRVGDIRHARADIARARALLGWEPRIGFDQGIRELAAWIKVENGVTE